MWSVTDATRMVTMRISDPETKPKDSKGTFKVRKVEEPVADKAVEKPKSTRQIRIRVSNLTAEDNDPFIRCRKKFMGIEDWVDAEGKYSCSSILVLT